ncbi:MAG: hypothetical protein IJR35_05740, partial [Synergistaceae bacterium]|nr:hypothetical protein [Synergistaceae bacterium]
MFYRLKDNFVLRGYEKLPYAVVNIKTGAANFIDGNMMNALEYCNGNIDLSLPVIPEEVREYIAIAEKAGVIEPCEQGHALT